ncbi:MAG: flap endonuclease-1 [Candidatus Woesearchaeota archaeon]
MGVKITDLVPSTQIDFASLCGKIVVVDASLFLYQFLTTIRQPDGSSLMDSNGRITSHLVGLFSRTTRLMQYGIKLAYVFDGVAPALKRKEQARRRDLKMDAVERYEKAAAVEDMEGMLKYAKRTARLDSEMISESKELIHALGLPVVESPSEAEAQAAAIVRRGNAFALATQDADSLMFGATRIVRNLSLVGKRKIVNKLSYESVKPDLVILSDTMNVLGIDSDQLIALCMLVGTDYNPGGIKGIGQKNALKLVQQYGKDFKSLFAFVKWDDSFEFCWQEVFDLIRDMPVSDDCALEWRAPDSDKVRRLLVDKHEFSLERVDSSLSRLKVPSGQKGLGEFL